MASSSHAAQYPSYSAGARSSSGSSSSSSFHHHNNHATSSKHWSNGPADMPEPFTPEMRDLQARGKDPYAHGPDLGRSGGGGGRSSGNMRMGAGSRKHHHQQHTQQSKEPFQKTERRDWAETVLDSPELLLMYAQSSGDTLPATRHKFKKIMCGLDYDDEDEAASLGPGGPGAGSGSGGQYQQQAQFNGAGAWSHGGGEGGGSRGGRR